MPTTKIAAAEDALKAILDARAGLDGVAVDLGFPAPGPEEEHVWIAGDVDAWDQELDVTDPNGIRTERFTLNVIVYVVKDTYLEARDRAIVLAAEVESGVRGDVTLTDTISYAELAGGRKEEGIEQNRHQVRLVLQIACEAFLTA